MRVSLPWEISKSLQGSEVEIQCLSSKFILGQKTLYFALPRQPSTPARDVDSFLFISALRPQRAMAEVDFDEDICSSEVWKDILEHWKLLVFPL